MNRYSLNGHIVLSNLDFKRSSKTIDNILDKEGKIDLDTLETEKFIFGISPDQQFVYDATNTGSACLARIKGPPYKVTTKIKDVIKTKEKDQYTIEYSEKLKTFEITHEEISE